MYGTKLKTAATRMHFMNTFKETKALNRTHMMRRREKISMQTLGRPKVSRTSRQQLKATTLEIMRQPYIFFAKVYCKPSTRPWSLLKAGLGVTKTWQWIYMRL
jgi:hypothetical protein